MAYRDGKAALELVVVVTVEHVVFAIVLVVDDGVGRGEALAEDLARGGALAACAIGIAAPGEIGLGELRIALPAALVDERLETGAVRPGLCSEDAIAGAAARLIAGDPGALERAGVRRDARGQRIDRLRLIERRHCARRRVDEIDEV